MELGHTTLGLLAILASLVLLALRLPVAVALALPALISVNLITGRWNAGPQLGVSTFFQTFTTDSFIVIPMFVFMGTMAFQFGLVHDLFNAAQRWLSRFRGGLALATVFGCAGFAAVTGSSAACVAAVGRTAMPELVRAKYSEPFAAATVAASGTLGLLIPPSTILVIYAILAEQSVAAMLLAGIIPGIIEAIIYGIVILIWISVRPELAPATMRFPVRDALRWTGRAWAVPVVFLGVIGGIAAGIWTPVEASAAGATAILAVGIVQGRFTRVGFTASVAEAGRIVGATFPIVAGAFLLGRMLALSGITHEITDWATASQLSPMAFLMGLLGLYLLLGMIMEGTSILALTVPLVAPIMIEMGVDGVWLGIIITKMVEMALITPPVGLNVFTLHAVWPSVKSELVFRYIAPFFLADVVATAILIGFPDLVTFIPRAVLN